MKRSICNSLAQALLVFVFLVSAEYPSAAFTLNSSTNSNLNGWAGNEVRLMVNTSNCPSNLDVPAIIAGAADVWNNVPTSNIKVSYGGTTTSTTYASPPTVYCETNFQSVTGADQNYVPGAASVGTSQGQISQGLLYLNVSAGTANISNMNQAILKVILAHEIGHLLGLGHSESTNALMYYDASAKSEARLSQDDIDGISYLYPSNEIKDNKIAGCGLIGRLPPPGGGSFSVLLLLLLASPLAYAFWLKKVIGLKPRLA